MNKIYQVYQVSDSTGETLDRIFLAIKAQFSNFNCKTIHYSFTRTENQILKRENDELRQRLKLMTQQRNDLWKEHCERIAAEGKQ